METKQNYAAVLASVASKMKDKKLANIKSNQAKLDMLGEYLNLTMMQTIIFIAIFNQTCKDDTANISDIASFYDVSNLDIMAYAVDIKALMDKSYIVDSEPKLFEKKLTEIEFTVHDEVMGAILSGQSIPEIEPSGVRFSQYDLVNVIREMIANRKRKRMVTGDLLRAIEKMENNYKDFRVVSHMIEIKAPIIDRIMFYLACNRYITEKYNKECDLDDILDDLYDHPSDAINYKQKIFSGESRIAQEKLVSFWNENEGSYEFILDDAGKEILLQEHSELYGVKMHNLDKYEFVNKVADYIEEREHRKYTTNRLVDKICDLEMKNLSNEFVKEVRSRIQQGTDRAFFYKVCHSTLDRKCDIDDIVDAIYRDNKVRIEMKNALLNGNYILMENELVELGEASFFGSAPVNLTEGGKDLFLGEESLAAEGGQRSSEVISTDSIKAKNLYYSQELGSQVSFLRDSLNEDKFKQLQERLSSQALPSGVAAIFYGSPGTGKTETVYQLAKTTGRDVMQVDISEMKTCWYGESQKLVRGVFKKYQRIAKKSKLAPILLFNEADAIFGRRSENPERSVDKTDNAIQNIILEEMEKLEGILIATTNLASNLDPAFERRFLFKICFEKPTVEAKALIWKDKLSTLTDSQARELAECYDFSGGEIDNIVRKVTMNEVLYGSNPDINDLHTLCSQERLGNETARKRIGFK